MMVLHLIASILLSVVLFASSPIQANPVLALDRYPMWVYDDDGLNSGTQLMRPKKWTRLEPSIRFGGVVNPYLF
ncbi:unnamed protein product [Anisakis simplex]|uniref:Uncharacterized protein n=1 Tax=Anisakis simplex TaxID=6269 RepID=A0A0M3JXI9_ANISI|nr:unnamed protein product [Anisakis simplex]